MLSVLFQNILLPGLIFVTKHVDSQTSTQQYLMLPPVGDWETLWNCELSGPMTQSSSNLWLPSPDLSDRRLTAASTICAVFWMSGISSARPSDPSSSCLLLLFTLLLLATNKTIHGLEGCNVIPSLTCSLPEHFQWGTSENLFFSCLLQPIIRDQLIVPADATYVLCCQDVVMIIIKNYQSQLHIEDILTYKSEDDIANLHNSWPSVDNGK